MPGAASGAPRLTSGEFGGRADDVKCSFLQHFDIVQLRCDDQYLY